MLDADATDRFIAVTHEKYKATVGDHFGKDIKGIFTDEPQMMLNRLPVKPGSDVELAWTSDMESGFYDEYGSDIADILPEVIWESKNKQYVWQFREYLSSRFSKKYSERIGKWCDYNGIALTGHMMAEQSMESQTEKIGDAMRHYVHFGIPGVDMLIDRYEYLTVKQAQSVVHQSGKNALLSELYGVTDWDCDFRKYKLIGDWQAALGVTLRVPHLAHVSLKGKAKRDFPASISYQSPWYGEYKYIEDHFARLNTVLTCGKPIVRVGVIHPIESLWHEAVYGRSNVREQLDSDLENLIKWLLFGNIDFDFINEGLLCEQKIVVDEGKLSIGYSEYSVILVPGCKELRGNTRDILNRFKAEGGTVIFAGQPPQYDRGVYKPMDVKAVPFDRMSILNALMPWRDIKITHPDGTDAKRFIYNYRNDGDRRWLFICYGAPEDRVKTIRPVKTPEDTIIRVKGKYLPLEYDTLTGDVKEITYMTKNGFTYIKKAFYSHDSLLLRLTPACDGSLDVTEHTGLSEYMRIRGLVNYTLSEENALLLDVGRYAFDNDSLSEECEELLRIGKICSDNLYRSENKEGHSLRIRFDILSDCIVDNVILALEDAELCTIIFNDRVVAKKACGYYVDKAIQKVALGCIRKGKNVLDICIPYNTERDIEWMYLLGDFGVVINGTEKLVVKKPDKIGFSSLATQMLPFYTGNVSYNIRIDGDDDEWELAVPKYKGALVKVYLDGVERGIAAFEPYRVHLGRVSCGEHLLTLKLFGNRFNGFGSLHNTDEYNRWSGPERWYTNNEKWGYEYFQRDMGILSGPIIYKREFKENGDV